MKKLILLTLLSFNVSAASLNVDLDSVTLTDLVKITYGDLTDNDFIIDDDLIKNQKKFTVNLTDLKPNQMKPFLDKLLKREGYQIDKSEGIYTIFKSEKNADFETYIYEPKFRKSNDILNSIKQSFPLGTFGRNQDNQINQTQTTNNIETTGSSAFDNGLTNTQFITVQGNKKTINDFKNLVVQVDLPISELMITSYIYEVSNDSTKENSLNLAANILGSKLGFQTNGNILNSFFNINALGINAIVSALNTDSRFKVLSSPFLRVCDKQKANFVVGSDVPILGAIQNNGNGQSTQSVQYRRSGIILNIEPTIYSEQFELKINQELSNFVQTQTGVNNSPTLITRAIETVVNANDDEVIILGGLDESRDLVSRSGFPFLPDWLKNSNKSINRSSIIIVMHVKKSNKNPI